MVSGRDLDVRIQGLLVRPQYWLWLFLVQFCWTGSYVAMKWAGDEMPVGVVVFLRYGGASLGFLVGNLFTGLPRWHRSDLGLLALLGALNFALAPTLQIGSLRYTQAIDVSILIALEPMLTALVAALLLKEHVSRQTGIALAVGTVGMFLLSGVGLPSNGGWAGARLLGNLMFFSSLLFEVAVTVAGRRLAYRYRPSDAVQAMMLAGFLTAGVVYAGPIAAMDFSAPSMRAWGSIVYLVLGPSIFSYTLWYRILREVPANRVALSLFFQPVIGTCLGYFLLGETIGLETLLGGALVCGGLAWWQTRGGGDGGGN